MVLKRQSLALYFCNYGGQSTVSVGRWTLKMDSMMASGLVCLCIVVTRGIAPSKPPVCQEGNFSWDSFYASMYELMQSIPSAIVNASSPHFDSQRQNISLSSWWYIRLTDTDDFFPPLSLTLNREGIDYITRLIKMGGWHGISLLPRLH